MKVHKDFIKKLAEDKFSGIGEMILDLKIVKKTNGSILNIYQKLEELESIFYTVEFLLENKLIEFGDYHKDGTSFPITSTFEDPEGDELVTFGKTQIIKKYLDKYWGQRIFVKPILYKYIDNGFKTDEEKNKNIQFWHGVLIAVISSLLTSVLTAYFSSNNCINF